MARAKKNRSYAQKIIFVVIILAFLLVIISTALAFILKPENIIKSKISTLSTNYFENFLYPNIDQNSTSMLQKYETYGFANISLRQLIYFDQNLNQSDINYLKSHCDENATYVKFYLEPPYSKTSYRAEYHYSCEF